MEIDLAPIAPLFEMLIGFAILAAIVRGVGEIGPELVARGLEARKRKRAFEAGRVWRSDQDLVRWLRGMRPTEFEKYVVALYEKLGYKARHNGGPHDGGIDVVAEKDGVVHYIQCKKFITSEVGVSALRDFYGAMAGNRADGKGIFITTSKYSTDAEKFADDKPIELIDSFKLVKLIRLAEGQGFDFQSVAQKEKCPECGGVLMERSGKFGRFLGCENYPKCKYTRNV